MVRLIIAGACLFGIAFAYFFNMYIVFTLAIILCLLYWYESHKPLALPGTSGQMGGMIFGFFVLVPFVITMIITSLIFNQSLVVSFFKGIIYYASMIFLR